MEIHIKIIGWALIVLALVHSGFKKRFNWKVELENIGLLNKQMMYVHTFFIALVLLLMGVLCLTSAIELQQTQLGKKICIGFGVFWAFRLLIQFFGYSSKLWKGKKIETSIHILFSLMWIYFTTIFFYVALI